MSIVFVADVMSNGLYSFLFSFSTALFIIDMIIKPFIAIENEKDMIDENDLDEDMKFISKETTVLMRSADVKLLERQAADSR